MKVSITYSCVLPPGLGYWGKIAIGLTYSLHVLTLDSIFRMQYFINFASVCNFLIIRSMCEPYLKILLLIYLITYCFAFF